MFILYTFRPYTAYKVVYEYQYKAANGGMEEGMCWQSSTILIDVDQRNIFGNIDITNGNFKIT